MVCVRPTADGICIACACHGWQRLTFRFTRQPTTAPLAAFLHARTCSRPWPALVARALQSCCQYCFHSICSACPSLVVAGSERGRRGAVRAHHSLRGTPGEQAQRRRGVRANGDEGIRESRDRQKNEGNVKNLYRERKPEASLPLPSCLTQI